MRLCIEPGAAKVLDCLMAGGHAAYVVGGCVRDALLGRLPSDWDICTSASPQETIALFGEERCIPTGIRHGTVTVRMDGGLYEVTTFRTEGTYSDGRHPDSVSFVRDVREDLARRDFTINAMAYNDRDGLVDPFGGQADLLVHGVVRAVGEPMRRFSEDALRIMRLYRFAARFGFLIEEETGTAALALRENLSRVSAERILTELMKLLETRQPSAYLPQAVAGVFMPELARLPAARWEQALHAADALAPDAALRLAALLFPLCDGGDAAAAHTVMQRLRCSNRMAARVGGALDAALAQDDGEALDIQAKRLLGQVGIEVLEDAAALAGVLGRPQDALRTQTIARLAQEARAKGLCCHVKQLAVNGGDVMRALGAGAGPGIGLILNRLLEEVLCGRLENEREALLRAANEWKGMEIQ